MKWSDYCSPLAYKPGEPYKLIAEASVDNFSSLGIAFMEDRLQMDNGMVPHKIVCKYFHKLFLMVEHGFFHGYFRTVRIVFIPT